MKKYDGRKGKDNSRAYHSEREEKTKDALTEICTHIRDAGEPRTFAHVAASMMQKHEKPIAISAQTIQTNSKYRQIFNTILKDELEEPTVNIRKYNPKSNAELRNELHQEKIKVKKLKSEVKIYQHQIKQSNIATNNNTYDTPDLQMINQLEMSNKSLIILMQELSKLGDFYWDKEGFKRASDRKIFLTQKSMLTMGFEPKQLPLLPMR